MSTYKPCPYVVLDDLSTYSGLSGCVIALLSEESEDVLFDTMDFKHVDLQSVDNVVVSIEDLIDAYNQVHGDNI